MIEFNQGPWAVGGGKGGGCPLKIYHNPGDNSVYDGVMMADAECAFLTKDQSLINAHLIAAAPCLFNSLKNIVDGIEIGLIEISSVADEQLAHAIKLAKDALFKAQYEPSKVMEE